MCMYVHIHRAIIKTLYNIIVIKHCIYILHTLYNYCKITVYIHYKYTLYVIVHILYSYGVIGVLSMHVSYATGMPYGNVSS